MDKPLHRRSLIEVAQGIRNRQFNAEAYTLALLERIASLDGEIQAWAWIEPEEAIRAARLSDRKRDSGGETGPLDGIPVGVKDIFATAGVPTEMGSPAFAGHVPEQSAEVVLRIETQGGYVIGKTVTTECAFLHPGKTRNPWNGAHTPGGSSSGSAAAVAAGFVPAALGTQTNGSVIRPAAYCGVVGYKPTQGRIPIAGALTFSHTLDQPGLFTRSVADAAWFASALTGGDRERAVPIEERTAPPHLAAVRSPVWEQAGEEGRRVFQENIAAIRKAGARVTEVELPGIFGGAHQAIRMIMAVESALNLQELHRQKAPLLSATLTDFIAEGAATGAVVYLQALKMRLALQQELAGFFAAYDAIITPSTTGEAPATLEQTGNPAFCSIWSLCGVPAITIPVGFGPRGLPLGLQIVGAHGNDHAALSAAHWCEGLFSFPPFGESR